MFTDKQLTWAVLVLGTLTAGVVSISSPVYSQKTKAISAPPPPIKSDSLYYRPNDFGHLAPAPPPLQTRFPILPPPEYDRPYDGDLTIRVVPTFEALRVACNVYNPAMLACARHNAKSCIVYLVEDELMRERGWNTGLLLRHEIGHCNGWPSDHPDERKLPTPLTHWVPASERLK